MKIYKAVIPEVGDQVVVTRGADPRFSGEGVIVSTSYDGRRYGIKIGNREEYIMPEYFHIKGYKDYDNHS